jgi:hypothetical protein
MVTWSGSATCRPYQGSVPKQPLPVRGADPNPAVPDLNVMGCLTCHFAHGSAAAGDWCGSRSRTDGDSAFFYDGPVAVSATDGGRN